MPSRQRLTSFPVVAVVVALAALVPLRAQAASISLAWDETVDPTLIGYRLYYDTDSGEPYQGTQATEGPSPIEVTVASLTDPSNPEVSLSGLPSCEVFYFAVTAYNDAGESGYSAEIVGTVVDAPDPISVSPSTDRALSVAWAGLPSEDTGSVRFYDIHYDTDSGEPYEGAGSPVTVSPGSLSDPDNPSQRLTDLQPGVTYYVAVEAVCPDDFSKLSEEASSVPTGQATGGGGSVGGGSSTGGTGGGGNVGGTSSGGAGGDGWQPAGSDDEGGCGCRLAAESTLSSRGAAWAALLLLAARRRRR